MELIYLLVGLALGGIIAWFIAQSKSGKQQMVQEKRSNHLEGELSHSRTKLAERDDHIQELNQKLDASYKNHVELNSELATAKAEHKNLQEKLDSQKQELEQLNQKFATEFKNLANEIFEEKSKKFTTQNKENLGEILNPLRDKILEFQKKVEDNNTAGEKRSAALGEQLKNLRELNQQITQEAKNLTQALRGDSKTQGNWGEMQLEKILEKAGLEKDTHFFKEKNYKTEEGANQRLDFIINLPDGKHLVLDSKVSLSAYAKYFETEDEKEQATHLKDHLASINNHIKLLGEKNYQNLYGITTPDYVLMFVANEPALTMALKEDASLYEKALSRNIVLVSTTTLLATLRTISYIWKQDLQNKNAEEIARQAGALYDKFVGFTDDLLKLGGQLDTVTKTYKESMKKLSEGTGNLVRRTEKLRKLGAESSKVQNPKLIDRSE